MKVSERPVVVEQMLAATPQRVWNAITRLDRMHKWYFEQIPAFEPLVGFKTEFAVHSGGRKFVHRWEIIEVEPNRKIVYRWNYPDYDGDSFVTFELIEQGNQTLLRLIATVTEDFSDDIPEFRRESCEEGWNYFIRGRLAGYIEESDE
jgi:uncharacterized protein YndB with AHSA1/START domain